MSSWFGRQPPRVRPAMASHPDPTTELDGEMSPRAARQVQGAGAPVTGEPPEAQQQVSEPLLQPPCPPAHPPSASRHLPMLSPTPLARERTICMDPHTRDGTRPMRKLTHAGFMGDRCR